MFKNSQVLQASLSIGALLCMMVGWLMDPTDITIFLYRRLFYVLVGVLFVLQASSMKSKAFTYSMYVFGAAAILGALFPLDSQLATSKTVGLLGGVIVSMIGKNRH